MIDYTVRLVDGLDVDLREAADRKIAVNESKYPADRAREKSGKYTEDRDKRAG